MSPWRRGLSLLVVLLGVASRSSSIDVPWLMPEGEHQFVDDWPDGPPEEDDGSLGHWEWLPPELPESPVPDPEEEDDDGRAEYRAWKIRALRRPAAAGLPRGLRCETMAPGGN